MKKSLRHLVLMCALLTTHVLVNAQQSPFNGSPTQLPGTIEAEDFDIGGQAVAYYDVSSANIGGQYRSELVDIESCSDGGFNIHKIETYEWLEYTINLSDAANFKFEFRVASTNSAGTIAISLDGVSKGSVSVPNTGGMQTWRTVKKSYGGFGGWLPAGEHVLRLSFSNSETHYDMFNIDKVIVSEETSFKYAVNNIPGKIEAEHYDLGGFNNGPSAYNDLTAGNSGGINRSIGRIPLTEDVDMEACSEGGRNIGWIDQGEWLEYTVEVSDEDLYDIDLRVASNTSNGALQLQWDGADLGANVTVPFTGGWQNWTTLSLNGLPLSAGTHTLKVLMTGSSFNLNYIEFTKVSSVGCSGVYLSDYSYEISNDIANPTITFEPILNGVGDNLVILYYGVGNGPYPGHLMTPGQAFQISANNGNIINFYFTYSHPNGGERNSSATPHTFTVGSCGGSNQKTAFAETDGAISGLSLFPNPVSGANQLFVSESIDANSVTVFDAIGQARIQLNNWKSEEGIDVSSLGGGVYHVLIDSNDGFTSLEFVK